MQCNEAEQKLAPDGLRPQKVGVRQNARLGNERITSLS